MPDTRILIIGAYLNSALYLTGAAVFGYLTNHLWSWRLALISFGVSFLCYVAQIMGARGVALALSIASIATGIASGLFLLG